MAVPPAMLAYVRGSASLGASLPGIFQDGVSCDGSEYHTPNPLLVHRYQLTADLVLTAESTTGRVMLLCGTCADNLRVLLTLLRSADGVLPWEVRREFGNKIRQLGMTAWTTRLEAANG